MSSQNHNEHHPDGRLACRFTDFYDTTVAQSG